MTETFFEKVFRGVFLCFHIIYEKHAKTKKNAKTIKKKVDYRCECCDYNTSNKTDYKRHLKTKKHLRRFSEETGVFLMPKNANNVAHHKKTFCKCGKKFKSYSGLWKHSKKCNKIEEKVVFSISNDFQKFPKKFPNGNKKNENDEICDTENIEDIDMKIKQVQLENAMLMNQKLKKEINQLDNPQPSTNLLTNELVETIGKIAGNNNCNNTNNISINMYLNEHCKNAMNLEDFVRNIKVSLQDLDFSTKNGYVKGIENIFIKQLEDLKPTERPIHCSDKKRLQFYVKDDDTWKKDEDHEKLTESIKAVSNIQVKKMTDWEKQNPDYTKDPQKSDKWSKMLDSVIAGENSKEVKKNETKIKKILGKVVDIKEELKGN